MADVEGDGSTKVIWGSGATSTGPDFLYIADMQTRQIEWQNMDIDGPLSAVDVGDLDGDGKNEIAMVSFGSNSGYDEGVIHVFDAQTHALKWQTLLGIPDWMGVRSVKDQEMSIMMAIQEMVVTSAKIYDGVIQVWDGKTQSLKRQSAGYNGNFFTALAIGDADSDGRTEIVAGQGREHTGCPRRLSGRL